MKQDRMARVDRVIRSALADMIPWEVKDPRVNRPEVVAIAEVQTTKDLRFAKVFMVINGDRPQQQEALSGLQHASKFIRSELGKRVHLRYVPELHFCLDQTIESASRIEQILKEIAEEGEADE